MPWRLIRLALVFVVFLIFIGSNLDNRCAISFAFWTKKDIFVFLPILIAFVLGLLCSIPFAISMSRKGSVKNDTPTQPKKKWGKDAPAPEDLSPGGSYDID
ncbi:hypothetical protein AGMMS4952_16850 [Spirochaetia bacterium]|nr:hypothetical protein AGMMS4952_16850 [Spirochaetia bacterium]